MIKKIAAIAVMIFCAAATYGQNGGDLNRQISVAKDYAPTVDKAAKLAITPQMNDTVTLRPDFDYIVRPKAWMQGFSVSPIRPATVDAATYDPRYPFYLKAGGGYPGQTLFDFYANTTGKGRSSLGFYLNHYGQLANIDVEGRGKTDAKSTRNSTGVFGTTGFGRYALSGEVGWDYDVFSLYGDLRQSPGVPMQHYSVPRARIVFGNDFTDLSYFNFRLGGDGYLLEDRRGNKETGVGAFVEGGKRFGVHNITLKADFESFKGGGQRDGTDNTIVRAGAKYELRAENFLFMMGGVFAYDKTPKETETYFLPQAELRLSLSGGAFSPYLTLKSSITANSLLRISSLNPYTVELYGRNFGIPSMAEYNLRGGFSGAVGSMFSYNVFAGGDVVKNSPLFMRVSVSDPIMGTVTGIIVSLESKRRVFTAGAELEAHIGGSFTVAVAGQYFNNKDEDRKEINYLPKYTASLKMTYNHRDKLLLRAGVDVRGEYEFLPNNFQGENLQAPAAADLSLGAQYNLSPAFGIFVEANNLVNQKLYLYPFYQGVGMNISAGVKVKF